MAVHKTVARKERIEDKRSDKIAAVEAEGDTAAGSGEIEVEIEIVRSAVGFAAAAAADGGGIEVHYYSCHYCE